jgi:hypothetical protein
VARIAQAIEYTRVPDAPPPSKDDLHDEEGKSQTLTAPLGERRSAHFPEELTMRGKFA